MPTTTMPKLSEMLGLPQCLTDAERGTAIAVYNHSGESAALKSAHNMLGKRIAALQAENAALKGDLLETAAYLHNELRRTKLNHEGDFENCPSVICTATRALLNGGAK